jgi:CBS domain-containing protein
MAGVEKSLRKYFGKRSEQVVQDNLTAVRRGYSEVREIPRAVIQGEEATEMGANGKLVRDVMHHGVIACRPTTPRARIAQAMAERDISAIVVVDKDGALQGLVSSTDLVRAQAGNGDAAAASDLLAEQIMSRDVITTSPSEPLSAAMKKLIEHRVHRLVVVQQENGHQTPVGILSATDLARLPV